MNQALSLKVDRLYKSLRVRLLRGIMNQREYVLGNIKELSQILEFQYGSPNHNNKKDPLDEMIFILLSRRTRKLHYEKTFEILKQNYPSWELVAEAPSSELFKIIRKAGLGKKRAIEIQENLKIIKDKFGDYSLNKMRTWQNQKIFDTLLLFKGIGPKSAYCIMMYSFNRKVFPVDTHINRICQRLGLIESGMNHKKAQELLANYFPESFRYALHVNLLAHGREICLPKKPKCYQCLISGFCSYNRKKKTNGKNKFIDLFAGAGGLSHGFEKAGFDLELAVESNTKACTTLLFNRPQLELRRVINKKIEEIDPKIFSKKGIKVLVAGLPCQEFSWVRTNGYGNWGRKELYKELLRVVSLVRPLYIVIENVPGMRSETNIEYAKKIENGLKDIGYAVRSDLVNAKYYGIPQKRTRLFFICKRVQGRSISSAERSLDRIWQDIHSKRNTRVITFRQAISGLPHLKPNEGRDMVWNNVRGRRSNYAKLMQDNNGSIIFNHRARSHNNRDLEAYRILNEGENAIDLYNKRSDLMIYSTENFSTKYFKIRGDEPSPTILAHLRKDANSFIHPDDNRGITPREAARLQSFPDEYRFLANYSIQFEQIGNAVPPLLAYVIAEAIKKEMGTKYLGAGGYEGI